MAQTEYPSRRARRLYRRLLRLYPRWFRALYADQMCDDFVDLFQTPDSSRSLGSQVRCGAGGSDVGPSRGVGGRTE